jgi:hypothetical protein
MLIVLALAAAISSAASEDGRQPIREGTRVRALMAEDPAGTTFTHGARPLVGRVVSVQGDTMTVETSRGAVVLPFKGISRLEVSRRGRNLKRGALIGGLVGFAAATAIIVASFAADDDYAISTAEGFAIGAVVGAPTGGVIGLGAGALAPAWHDVPVPGTATRKRVAALIFTIRF